MTTANPPTAQTTAPPKPLRFRRLIVFTSLADGLRAA
jgi:hypothetical protein